MPLFLVTLYDLFISECLRCMCAWLLSKFDPSLKAHITSKLSFHHSNNKNLIKRLLSEIAFISNMSDFVCDLLFSAKCLHYINAWVARLIPKIAVTYNMWTLYATLSHHPMTPLYVCQQMPLSFINYKLFLILSFLWGLQ